MEVNRLEVIIDGRSYKLVSEQSEEYLARLATFVNHQTQEVKEKFPHISTTDTMTLVAINITDELLRLRDDHDAMDNRIARLIGDKKVEETVETTEVPDFAKHTRW